MRAMTARSRSETTDDDAAVSPARIPDRLDVPFAVPFTHRTRFTRDVFGADDATLLDVLESAAGKPARVLAVVESALDAAADVAKRVRQFVARHASAVELIDVLVVDGGEAIKNHPQAILPLLQAMLDGHVDRRNYVLAVGGGAMLDAVGFASAMAHRGVRLVRVPSTIMGQADSGLAVKNAINFFGKKNWLGTFAVPWAVINDRRLLTTLPDRDWRCGFAEAVKVAMLKDAAFFDSLCADAPRIAARDAEAADRAIRQSAYWHLRHITQGGDPFEMREARPLDFGHWSAHRLEAMTHFDVRHGEAVAIGLAIDCAYSRTVLGLPADRERQAVQCLRDLGLKLNHPALADTDALLAGLEEFRQHLGGRLTITLLNDIARPIDVHEIDSSAMRAAIAAVRDAV